jgi:hypothetical protein
MSETSRSLWQLLLLTRDAGMPVQLTCEECLTLLEYDAELLASGAALDEILPVTSHHLSLCSKCKAKINGWLKGLDEDNASHNPYNRRR